MSGTPNFTKDPNLGQASITTVNTTTGTAADSTSNMNTLVTGATTYGSLVRFLQVAPRGGNAACVLRVWLNNGSTRRLLSAHNIAATSASTTVAPPVFPIPLYIQLEPNWSIDVNISAAASPLSAAVDVTAFGADYSA